MSENLISKFQMKAYSVDHFSYTCPAQIEAKEINHRFDGEYNVDYFDDQWYGAIILDYHAATNATEPSDRLSVEMIMHAVFSYNDENTETAKEQFIRFLKANGAVSLFSIMRGHIATATTSLGMRPGLVMPSINLRNFVWKTDLPSNPNP